MKTKRLPSIMLAVLSAVIIIGFVYYLYLNADKYKEILHISAEGVILLLILSACLPFLNGMINTYMFRSLGAGLSHKDGFHLAAASTMANQLPVSGGIVTRAVYLKYKYNLAYAKYFSAMMALFFCTIAVYGLLGIAILLYWIPKGFIASPILFIAFGGMGAGLLIFWLPFDSIKLPGPLLKLVHQAIEGWMLMSRNPILLLKLLLLQTATMLILAFRYWVAFHMLSQNVSISQVILFSSASVLTQLVSFAPGGLGVREAIVAGIASALGFEAGISVAAVGLDRLVATIVIMIVGWISTLVLGREFSRTALDERNREA